MGIREAGLPVGSAPQLAGPPNGCSSGMLCLASMHGGRIVKEGPPTAVIREDVLASVFNV